MYLHEKSDKDLEMSTSSARNAKDYNQQIEVKILQNPQVQVEKSESQMTS